MILPISVQGVSKSYPAGSGLRTIFSRDRRRVLALSDISFEVSSGECFGILGLNGAGKTTLLKLIATLLVPDSGRVAVLGYDAKHEGAEVRARIGICSANERSFYGRLSVRENLRFFGRLHQLPEPLLNERIPLLCETLGLAEKIDDRVEALSTGMKQRLSLIRALLSDPPVIVLDEPTRALDPIGALAFRAFVKNRLIGEQRKTVLVATNLLEEARMLCNRVAVLHDHRIAAVGAADDLLTPAFLTAFTDALPELGVSREASS